MERRETIQVPVIPRQTKQKHALREAFVQAARPLSPEEALELTQKAVPGVSIATIYRNINSLLEEGWLLAVALPGQASRYEISGKQHHHHFQCDLCSRVYDLAGCDVSPKPKLPRGFRVSGHELLLHGTCADCR